MKLKHLLAISVVFLMSVACVFSAPETGADGKVADGESARPSDSAQDDIRTALAFHAGDPSLAPLEDFSKVVIGALDRKHAEADRRLDAIRDQMRTALEKARDEAQKKGDLDAVLLFMEAIKDPDATPQADNPVLTRLFAQRDAAKAKVAKGLRSEEAPILTSALQRLEQMKRDETRKGNIALAKAVDGYQDVIRNVLGKPAAQTPAPPPKQAEATATSLSPSPTFGVGGPASERTLSMSAEKSSGVGLGRFETGEILVVQYLSGKYQYRYSTSYAPTSPDRNNHSDSSVYYYAPSQRPHINGPLRTKNVQTWDVPIGTAEKPFAIQIKDGGHYEFHVYGGPSWQGTITYKVTKLSVLQAKRLLASPEKDNFQWP